MSAAYSVMANYTMNFTLSRPAGFAGDTWNAEIYVFNDPTCWGCYYADDAGGGHNALATMPNTQWGADVDAATWAFIEQNERWRGVYYGVTMDLDATALTDQGNLVSCQTVVKPMSFGRPTPGSISRGVIPEVVAYQVNDTVEYVQAAQMPDVYAGKLKEGVYLPLRLDENHQRWHCAAEDLSLDGTATSWTIGASGLDAVVPGNSTAGTTSGGLYPGIAAGGTSAAGIWEGAVHLRPCSSYVGAICIQNINAAASLRFTFRGGWELQVQPGTLQTPFQKPSVMYDPVAEEAYFAVRRQMKDAYPAAYNHFGKLWAVIKTIAGFLGPAVKSIPVVGESIATIASAIGRSVDRAMAKQKAGAKAAAKESGGFLGRAPAKPLPTPPRRK
jgi:hypothetical protein